MLTVLATSAFLLLGADPAAETSLPRLFAETDLGPVPGVGLDEVSIRTRPVEVDLDLLLNGSAPGTRIDLNLFPDETVTVTAERVEPAFGGGLVWYGSIDRADDVILAVLDGDVCGSITWDERLFRITGAGPGVHRVSLVNEDLFADCGTTHEHAVHAPLDRTPPGASPAPARNPDIDILVVYSTAAKNTVGGTASMNNRINLAISETNTSYTNSDVAQRVRLVHTAEMVGYTENSSMSQILSDLRAKTDGDMDDAHDLRDQYGADAVVMICKNGQYCGIAYQMGTVSHNFNTSAFAVVNYSCATGYYSFGHELGHNFGCAHAPGDGGSGSYSYSYGFRTSNNQYRTVMAYSPGSRKKYFSNPDVTYNGWAMGTTSQDNARTLDNTAATVAGWRTAVSNDPTANFTASPVTGPEDLLVTFTDVSTGTALSLWAWDFGDGGSSNVQHPTHLYTDPGTYDVSLTVFGSAGNDTMTVTDLIVVEEVITGSATVRNGSGTNPSIFTSTSIPTLGEDWTGDVNAGAIGAGGFVFVFVYSGSYPGAPTAFGELLLDPASANLFTNLAIAVGGTSHHAIPMPADPVYAGNAAFAQAYLNGVAPSGQLTNAIDIVLGT